MEKPSGCSISVRAKLYYLVEMIFFFFVNTQGLRIFYIKTEELYNIYKVKTEKKGKKKGMLGLNLVSWVLRPK